MRSSAILKNLQEQEPLLEDFDDHGPDPEVVVQREPLLHEKLEALASQLKAVEAQIPAQHKSRTSRFRLCTILFLGATASAILTPSLLLKFMMDGIYHLYDDLLRDAQKRVQELALQLAHAEQIAQNITEEGTPYRAQLFEYLKPFYVRWWADENCGGGTGVTPETYDPHKWGWIGDDYFCDFAAWYAERGDREYSNCAVIANEGCAELRRYPNITEPLHAIHERAMHAYQQAGDINNQVNYLHWRIDGGFPGEVFDFWNGGWAVTIGGVASLTVLALAISNYVNAYRSHKRDITPFYQLLRAIPELRDTDEFKELVKRTGVDAGIDVDVKVLSKELKRLAKEARQRDERRMMFFRGKLSGNAGTPLHTFFHSPAGRTRDLQAMILKHADLLPASTPRVGI